MKVVLVEDEFLALRNLQIILDEISSIHVIATLDSISETVEWFNAHPQPDLLFLDIHLADGSAFDIFDRIQINCPIIFTTAYDEYALQAFKVNSIDYLLKPIDLISVQNAIHKLETLSQNKDSKDEFKKFIAQFKQGKSYKSHFLIPTKGDKLIPVKSSEIAYVYIDTSMVKALTFDERSFRLEHTLDELSEMLDPRDFFRANRQFIISRKAIKDIDLWFNNRLSVNLNIPVSEKILISKARITEFKNWFSGEQ
ncbi:MAG: response regulator transcription factor [Tannerellaceae bacterium]|nr:LytTR family DNA-binding domain-containing protein [uncultured Macellibacteroides sp.]MBN2660059.1 response regulator transcription factor [Tannerellaceae bacterium]